MATVLPGMCSVTFRQLSTDEVIDLAAQARLEAIEWGGDFHVTPGDVEHAQAVRTRCESVGLRCPSYGSYFIAARTGDHELDRVLDTANALDASTVRVWAPYGLGPDASQDAISPVVEALRNACDRAATRGITIALEFHPDTLTETARSATALLQATERDRLRTYWQPVPGAQPAHALAELTQVLGRLEHLHVIAGRDDSARLALKEHETLWLEVLGTVARQPDGSHVAYLEFVQDDDPDALLRDAATLRTWIGAG
jgi:sugar phosphate isomerase/epimerase